MCKESMGALTPNKHTIQAVIAAIKAQSAVSMVDGVDIPMIYKSKLDRYANMVVLGKGCFIFESIGKTFNVEQLTSELGTTQNRCCSCL